MTVSSTTVSSTTCSKCKRWVVLKEHPECHGDARSSCGFYGCGRKSTTWTRVEITSGSRVMIGWCERHSVSRNPSTSSLY